MPLKFPYPITIGTDICQISRIYNLLTKGDSKYTRLFLKRLLTKREQTIQAERLRPLRTYLSRLSQIEGESEPAPAGISNAIIRSVQELNANTKEALLDEMGREMQDVAVFMAGRFAAKEAVIKAYKTRRLTFHEINIISPKAADGSSLPPVTTVMSRRPAEKDQHIPLSISHDGDYATAFCLASEDMLPAGDPIPEDEALLEDEALSEDDTISEDDVEPAGPSRNASEPNSVRPPMTEEETLQKLNRQARLLERTESIYGLPPDVDPKVVKKNLENAAIVYDVPLETSSQELIDLFKGRCTVKGYVEKRSHREIARGFLVFQYARDAKRAMREAKFGTYMLRGKRLLIASVPEVPKNILKVYARCLKSDGFPLRGMAEGEIQQMDLDVNMGAKAIRKAIVHGQTINSIKLGEFWSTDIYHVQDNCANNVEP